MCSRWPRATAGHQELLDSLSLFSARAHRCSADAGGKRRPVTVLMNSTRRFPVSAATAAERCVQSGPQALNWERRKG